MQHIYAQTYTSMSLMFISIFVSKFCKCNKVDIQQWLNKIFNNY